MRVLHPPAPDETTHQADLDELYGMARPLLPDRPWVGVCMIVSLDGSTSVDGRSGGLGDEGDHAVFAALRRAADVILVGSATAAAEHYRPPQRPGQRIGVVSRTGRVDLGTELFASGRGFLVMPEDGPPVQGVDVVRAGHGDVDFAVALAHIGAGPGRPRFVQVEGGPTVNGALLDAGCVDELNLSIAPLLVGGAGVRLVQGARESRAALELAHTLADDDGYLFTRWVRPS